MTALWSLHPRKKVITGLPRVLVVGAGLAGLTAARVLHDTGFDVVVVEARHRIGGRVWTDRDLFGVPCERGATWIHRAEFNPMTTFAHNLGLSVALPSEPRSCAWVDNRAWPIPTLVRRSWRGVLRAGTTFAARYARVWLARRLGREADLSVEAAVDPWHRTDRLPRRDRSLVIWGVGMVEAIFGAPADVLTVRSLDPRELRGSNATVVGGYDQLVHALAQGLDIRLGDPVRTVAYDERGVFLHTDHGALRGDLAVITVPLGVLKAGLIRFDPPLDSARRTALQRIGFGDEGVLNKICLKFPRRFWPTTCDRFMLLPEDNACRGCFGVWIDKEHLWGQPILETFLAGHLATRWDREGMDEAVVAAALRVLRKAFPGRVPEPEAYMVTRWLSDPWARGSFAYEKVGTRGEDWDALTRPLGDRVYFAGEGVERMDYGTVEGALLSGERVARAIHRRWCCEREDLRRLPWR